MRSCTQQEREILTRYDGVSEISILGENSQRQAHIHPNLPLLASRKILNIREYIRLDVLDRYNRQLPSEEKIAEFRLCKEPLLEQRPKKNKKPEQHTIAESESREYALIISFLQHLGRTKIYPEDHLDIDLALTSLEKVQLFVFIESMFGLELNEQDFIDHFSVGSLARYVSQRDRRLPEQLPQNIAQDAVAWGKLLRDRGSLKLPESRLMHDLVLTLTGGFARFYFRLDVSGLENVSESPVIIASNHQCFFDGFIMGCFLPRSFMKNSYVLAEEKHFNTPFRCFVGETSNVIVVNRNRGLKSALRKMAAALQTGGNLIIFPEGTRTKDGRLGPSKETFAILSREFDVPVIPTAIQGGFAAMPSGRTFPKAFKKISVKFLPPIFPEGRSYREISNEWRYNIQTSLGLPNG